MLSAKQVLATKPPARVLSLLTPISLDTAEKLKWRQYKTVGVWSKEQERVPDAKSQEFRRAPKELVDLLQALWETNQFCHMSLNKTIDGKYFATGGTSCDDGGLTIYLVINDYTAS